MCQKRIVSRPLSEASTAAGREADWMMMNVDKSLRGYIDKLWMAINGDPLDELINDVGLFFILVCSPHFIKKLSGGSTAKPKATQLFINSEAGKNKSCISQKVKRAINKRSTRPCF